MRTKVLTAGFVIGAVAVLGAHVTIGPDMRRGVAELDGMGEAVGGIVIMRYGENALDVIDRVKKKLKEIKKKFLR